MAVSRHADLVKTFRDSGGGDKPVQAGTKENWDRDADAALDLVHGLWANQQLPGRRAQTLPSPKDFAAAMSPVPRDTVAEAVTCRHDSDKHAETTVRAAVVKAVGAGPPSETSTTPPMVTRWRCDWLVRCAATMRISTNRR
jgi:hypothetical protein